MERRQGLRILSIGVGVLVAMCLTRAAMADAVETVSINTSAASGQAGKLVFDLVTDHPASGDHVEILNFSAPGATLGLPETLGGLISGDLILLGVNPAPFTIIDTDFPFNELALNFAHFASSITFTLMLPDLSPPLGHPPDEFSLFLLNSGGLALFPTSDPLGADALFSIDVTGTPGGIVNAFSPAVAGPNNSIQITVPGGAAIPEPSMIPLFGSALFVLIGWKLREQLHRV